tara:strand:- start:302 stop:1732 length:1431 start_codon:yes stop_codon:yes gene_type:complete
MPKAKRAPTWTEYSKGFEYPDYGEDTRILDLIMEQRRPEGDSDLSRFPELGGQEEEASPEPPIYDPLGYRDIPRPLRGQDIRTPMGKPDELDLGVLETERLKQDPALYAMIAKSGAQMGTLGGKAADTSAVTGYADLLGKRKIRSEERRDKQKMALAKYLSGLRSQKNLSREKALDRGLQQFIANIRARRAGATAASKRGDAQAKADLAVETAQRIRKQKTAEEEAQARKANFIPGIGQARSQKQYTDLDKQRKIVRKITNFTNRILAIEEKVGWSMGGLQHKELVDEANSLASMLSLEYKEYQRLGALTAPDLPFLYTAVPKEPLAFDYSRDFKFPGLAKEGKSALEVKLKTLRGDMNDHWRETVQSSMMPGTVPPSFIQEQNRIAEEHKQFRKSYDPKEKNKPKVITIEQKKKKHRLEKLILYPQGVPQTEQYRIRTGEVTAKVNKERTVVGYFDKDNKLIRKEQIEQTDNRPQ